MSKQSYCAGCRNDFYNTRGDGKKCWSLEKAEVVTRYRIGWWTPMDNAKNFEKVTTLTCHHETGQFAFLKELPRHLVKEPR